MLIHIGIFCLESIFFNSPAIRRAFGVAGEHDRLARLFAFNQGFYNLFLAMVIGVGFFLLRTSHGVEGTTMIVVACAIMVGAGVVLLMSAPESWQGAVLQALPPAIALGAYWTGIGHSHVL